MNTTMSQAQEQVINQFQNHISRSGGGLQDWFIGITQNVRKKLFEEHEVSEQNGKWIYSTVENYNAALEIKKHFTTIGYDSTDSENEIGNIVFAFRKPLLKH